MVLGDIDYACNFIKFYAIWFRIVETYKTLTDVHPSTFSTVEVGQNCVLGTLMEIRTSSTSSLNMAIIVYVFWNSINLACYSMFTTNLHWESCSCVLLEYHQKGSWPNFTMSDNPWIFSCCCTLGGFKPPSIFQLQHWFKSTLLISKQPLMWNQKKKNFEYPHCIFQDSPPNYVWSVVKRRFDTFQVIYWSYWVLYMLFN
jgi:hypothetical protein